MPDESVFEGIPVHRFPFRSPFSSGSMTLIPSLLRGVAELKKRFQPDLVHLHVSDPSGFFHLKTSNAHPAPTLMTVHNHQARFGDGSSASMVSELCASCAWFTAVSRNVLQAWVAAYPALLEKSSVIYNGMELPHVLPTSLPFNPPRLLCLGRLVPVKRLDLALQVMAQVRRRFPEAQLTIAGEGISRRELVELAGGLGLGDCVRFYGSVPHHQVPELINAHTLLLNCSDWEGMPMAVMEAASMARPLVVTGVGGVPEIVNHGVNGLVVPPDDAQALIAAVLELLEHPDLAVEMGKAGRQLVAGKFSLEHSVSNYEEIYQRLVKEYAR
jgi:glycogen(starch) synthase